MPPSSIETLRTCSADCSINVLPTSVEPVKDSLRVLGSFSSGSITAPECLEVITFNTPPGRPDSSKIFASANIDSGRLLGRLDDHRAAGRHRRGDLAGAHRGGEVPGGHEHARPHRLAHGQDPAFAGRVDHVAAVDPDRLLGEPAQELGRVEDLRLRLRQRLAHLQGHDQGQLVGPLGHQLVGPAQDLAPLPGRMGRPFGLLL